MPKLDPRAVYQALEDFHQQGLHTQFWCAALLRDTRNGTIFLSDCEPTEDLVRIRWENSAHASPQFELVRIARVAVIEIPDAALAKAEGR